MKTQDVDLNQIRQLSKRVVTCNMGDEVWGDEGFRLRAWGFRLKVEGSEFGVWGLGFGVWGVRFGVWGLGFEDHGWGSG